jgi:xanthine/uracil permease
MAAQDAEGAGEIPPTTITPPAYSKRRQRVILTVAIFLGVANAFGSLGGTILLGPTIQDDLGMSTDELQWLTTSFYIPLVGVGCLMVSKELAD